MKESKKNSHLSDVKNEILKNTKKINKDTAKEIILSKNDSEKKIKHDKNLPNGTIKKVSNDKSSKGKKIVKLPDIVNKPRKIDDTKPIVTDEVIKKEVKLLEKKIDQKIIQNLPEKEIKQEEKKEEEKKEEEKKEEEKKEEEKKEEENIKQDDKKEDNKFAILVEKINSVNIDSNQSEGGKKVNFTDVVKKAIRKQNQENPHKKPLLSKLDFRRRSSAFSKKNLPPKIVKPTVERFLELCKRGSWTSIDKILSETKEDKIELNIIDPENGYGPIMYAAKAGKADIVDLMIQYGFDVNTKDNNGLTAMHFAAKANREDILRLLIAAKADPMVAGGEKKEYPIHCVIKKIRGPSVGALPLLLKLFPEQMRLVRDGDECIALMYAVELQNFGICRELLSLLSKEQLEAKRKKYGDTVLHIATRKRDLEMFRLLLDSGASVNSQNKEGLTPLHMVANDADDAWVRFLQTHGANPDVGDNQERTPLYYMVEKGSHRRVDYMIEKFGASINTRTKDGKTLVHAAAKSRTLELPIMFIKKGIPIKMQDRSGSRAIHTACQSGHVELVKNLLVRGENVMAQNNDGYTPLHVAVEAGSDTCADVLIANRADVNIAAYKDNERPIHVAARCPTGLNCVALLIKSGAEYDSVNELGRSPIMIAAEAGNLETVDFLLFNKADIDMKDNLGEDVFLIAVKMCHFKVAQLLLKTIQEWRSVDEVKKRVNQTNPTGETSVHYCAKLSPSNSHYENEERDLVKLLLKSGGDIVRDDYERGETPVHFCSRFGTDSIMEEIVNLTANVEFPLVVNKPSKTGFTPILLACKHGHANIITKLLQHLARVDVFDEKGRAGLHIAAELGHKTIVEILLQNKAFVNVRNKTGMTPLHLAAKNGYTEMVQELIVKYNAQIDAVTLTKQTPLQLAAEQGKLETCRVLVDLKADITSVDNQGQTPLHLAAQSNHSEVFRLFLEKNPALISIDNHNGLTCAHIAASKGSVRVIEELLKFDKMTVIKCKTKDTESTAVHMAAEKGHSLVVKMLVDAGAPVNEENKAGMTALHLAAQYGHTKVLQVLMGTIDLKIYSKRNGLTSLHVAASFGQADFVSELLTHVPGNILSQKGTNEPNAEIHITPLHLAAKNGHENVVRLLMNSTGVKVDSATKNNGTTPMHYAAEGGHTIAAGLLISRSAELLFRQDKHGQTCLHSAATQGHSHMITMLLGQGAEVNAVDKKNWTALHHAALNGHLDACKLLVEANIDCDAVNSDGKNAICLATTAGHIEVLKYLLSFEHDSLALMEDRNFLQDLMFCSKNHENKPIEEFIMTSDAPIYVAIRLASCFEQLANRNKDKAKDFNAARDYSDDLAIELLNIVSTNYSTSALLRAVDMKGVELLDVLIELERKNVVSQHAVQKYLSKVWIGGLEWSLSKFSTLFITFIICPITWVYISAPLNQHRYHQVPAIKFMSYLAAHFFLILLLSSILLFPTESIPNYHCCVPQWNEWLLIVWMIGLLVFDFMNPKDRSGLGSIKTLILWFGFAGIAIHFSTAFLNLFIHEDTFILEESWYILRSDALYIRNQIWACAMLFAFIDFLNFLTVHPLFGPWGVIIVELMRDLIKFVAVLTIFVAGFTLHICAIYQPVYRSHLNNSFSSLVSEQSFIYPSRTLEMLIYALLGHVQLDDMPGNYLNPSIAKFFMKTVFGVYMLVTIVVLINLLIAMMSNTYQRIEEQSDIQWKFGRAKLIQNMNRTMSTPSPLNLFVGIPFMLIRNIGKKDIKKSEKRTKSAKSGAYSQYLDVDEKSAIVSRRGSRTSLGTTKTTLSDNKGDRKIIFKVVNWKTVVKKYYALRGVPLIDDEF